MSCHYIAFNPLSKSSLLDAMPIGTSFNPSETELVSDYLCRKISQTMLSPLEEAFVQTCDLYGEEEPWQVWERLGGRKEEDLHLFTKLKLKTPKGARITRSVGTSGGYWHEEYGKPSQILEFNGKLETFQKKRYIYQNPGSNQHCCWIMFEYKCSLSQEMVLVVLNKNNKNRKRSAAAATLDIKCKNKKIRESFAEADGTKHIPALHDTTHQVHIEAVQEGERSLDGIVDNNFVDPFSNQSLMNQSFAEDDRTKQIPMVHDTTHQSVHIEAVQEAERSWESQVDDFIVDNNFQEAERSCESQVDDGSMDNTLTSILNQSCAEADRTKQIPMVHDITHQWVHIEAVQEAERSWQSQENDGNNFEEAEKSWESGLDDIIDTNDPFWNQSLTSILNYCLDEDGRFTLID